MERIFMKRFYLPLALGLISTLGFSQKPGKAPINPDFIQHVLEKRENKKSSGEHGTGYIPSPLYIHFNQQSVRDERKKSTSSLPEKYDLRVLELVTPVKDQGAAGACLSFSTMGAIESRWLKLGYGEYDLSEQNLATCHGYELGINDGGTFAMATAYLTRLSGPVTEASHPYLPIASAQCKEEGLVKTAYVPSVVWLPRDINVIKKAVMDYGAVSAAIYTGGNGIGDYYNFRDYTFYYNGTTSADHAVLIAGWDDNKTIMGGPLTPKGEKGAWIVKNSWGTRWGNKGYFYVSYKDTRFLSSVAIFPERTELEDLNEIFMYDQLGATSSYGYREETAYGLTRFETTSPVFIRKVGTFVNSSGSIIDIEIYDDFVDGELLNLIASSKNNLSKFPGYFTFDIPAIVNGDYYVKIKYTTPDYIYPIPVETKISYAGEDYALPEIQPSGTNWISRNGEKWEALGSDITDNEADLCIRVYADDNIDLNPFFTSDKPVVCAGSDITFTDASNGDIVSRLWNFGEGAIPATATGAGPHFVTYSTPGMKDISLTITGSGNSKKLEKKGYIEVVNDLDIFLPYSEKLVVNGKPITITAFGAEDYVWNPSEGLSTSTGNTVIASPADTTTYTVTGTMGSCTGSASITLNVVENPSNDDVAEALELTKTGYIGKFSNIYATVEAGEPSPPEGDCSTDMEWCVEGGVQNSVWFTFVARESGVASIDTRGMDNQIAIYKAANPDSIFTKSAELVAAFDDYYPEEKFFAAAIEVVNVEPGERYYIQIDGSAGGDEGEFLLYFYNQALGIDDTPFEEDLSLLHIYPNPGNGFFNLVLNDSRVDKVQLKVFDFSGRLHYFEEYLNIPGEEHAFYLENASPGIYFLEIESTEKVFSRKIVVH